MKKSIYSVLLALIALTSYGQQKKTQEILERFVNKPSQVLVAAHRGSHTNAPENSIQSIKDAISAGVEIVEIDVRSTKDGELVLMHDRTIDRTTNGKGEIANMTWKEVQALQLRHQNNVTDAKVPLFEQALQAAKGKIIVDIDFKSEAELAVEKCYTLIKKMDMLDEVLFFTYDYTDIPRLLALNPEVKIMPRARSAEDVEEILKIYPSCKVVHIDTDFYTDELGQSLQDRKVRVWENMLGEYDRLEGETGKGFEAFRRDFPYINIIQTDLPEVVLRKR